jgi:hypothetical protein
MPVTYYFNSLPFILIGPGHGLAKRQSLCWALAYSQRSASKNNAVVSHLDASSGGKCRAVQSIAASYAKPSFRQSISPWTGAII